MKTTTVNIYKEPFDVYCGRAGKGKDGYFGNPFPLQPGESRGATLEKYKTYFYDRLEKEAEFKRRVLELKGKRLGCFCKPQACHTDIIAEYLNAFSYCQREIEFNPRCSEQCEHCQEYYKPMEQDDASETTGN